MIMDDSFNAKHPVANGEIGRQMKRSKSCFSPATDNCAAAAAKGAALMLREQQIVDEVEIILPASETGRFRLHGQMIVNDTASCYVIRENGDDCDAGKFAKVHVSIKVDFFTPRRIVLAGGACNRQGGDAGLAMQDEEENSPDSKPMVLEVVREVFAMRCIPITLTVTVCMLN
jgi:cobalt-precorrin-5B (C1)-methyltransferase